MKLNVKGFTLVELLAVIVVLAIILAIAIPGISKIIVNSKRNAFENDAKMVLKAVELKKLENYTFNPISINETNIEEELNISPINYEKVMIKELDDNLYITIIGKNKWKDLTVSGTRQLTKAYNTIKNIVRGTNAPVLANGMTPIKWNGTVWVNTTESDEEWYNYNTTDKKWANAKTADGSFWVWIPRYIYNITSGWHSNTTGQIEVKFSQGVDDTLGGTVTLDTGASSTASNNKWTNHPAFTFGDTELTGFWIAKFEATAAEGVANGADWSSCPIASDNVSTKSVKIIPNIISWRCINIGNVFNASKNMENNSVYGWGNSGINIDTHLAKNVEWGAVAYLSKSAHGKETEEIWINNTSGFITGCAGDSVTDWIFDDECKNTYNTPNGVKASTTGNIYGIYDMSGATYEYTAAYVNNGNSILIEEGESIIKANSKYKDIYHAADVDNEPSHYALSIQKKGDALYETSFSSSYYSSFTSWYNDYSDMPAEYYPWFVRGGGIDGNEKYAGPFAFEGSYGDASYSFGFRPVIAVGSGL